jgi:hypothetical protein
MALLKPYTSMTVCCDNCEGECQVIVWDGVGDWEMRPAPELMAMEECIIVTLKVSPLTADGMAGWAVDTGPHVADRVFVWAKDTATYEMLLKLFANPSLISRPDDDDSAQTSH